MGVGVGTPGGAIVGVAVATGWAESVGDGVAANVGVGVEVGVGVAVGDAPLHPTANSRQVANRALPMNVFIKSTLEFV